ncbi:MAG: glycosyl hydrolase, partial [Bacteroidetes bacterium]|nr:glycosyl hydrolase [Bacteroidota bacterium]
WTSITSNLPERGSTFCIQEDFVDPNLLFAGTEFGIFFSNDGGKNWKQLKGGMPTIAIRDIAIQKRETDLVLASFGRGFFVLDDYSPLRNLKQTEGKEAYLFPIRDSWMYVEDNPLGIRGKGFLGESYYRADNPPVGATFTYFYKEDLKTRKDKRQDEESKLAKDNKDVQYPAYDKLKEESDEESPYLLFTVRNEKGDIIRKLKSGAKKGVNRITWDFRYPSSNPIRLNQGPNDNPFQPNDVGQLAAPGNYTVTLSKVIDGVVTDLAGPEKFTVKVLPGTTLPANDRPALVAWQRKAAELQRSIQGANNILGDANNKVKFMKEAILSVAKPQSDFLKDVNDIDKKLKSISLRLNGDRVAGQLDIDTPPPVTSRLFSAIYDGYGTTSDPTTTMKDQLNIASEEFDAILNELKTVVNTDIKALEKKLEDAGAPYTPGRVPDYKKQ